MTNANALQLCRNKIPQSLLRSTAPVTTENHEFSCEPPSFDDTSAASSLQPYPFAISCATEKHQAGADWYITTKKLVKPPGFRFWCVNNRPAGV